MPTTVKLVGGAPNQVPRNKDLGNLAYQNAESIAGPVGIGGPLTLSQGAINGVTYLNANKVLTAGSALTFDGTNLSNTGRFVVNNAGSAAGISDISLGSLSGGAWLNTPSGKPGYLAIAGSSAFLWDAANLISYIGGTEQMRLTSTGLGIGTSSPAYKLDVSALAGFIARLGTASASALFYGAGGEFGMQAAADGANAFTLNSTAGYAGVNAKTYIPFTVNGVERARLDSSGNLIQSAPTTPPTLATNGQMVFNLTSNTNLRVSVRGSDGVTRTANITLA